MNYFFNLAPYCHLNYKNSSLNIKIAKLTPYQAQKSWRATQGTFRARGVQNVGAQCETSSERGNQGHDAKRGGLRPVSRHRIEASSLVSFRDTKRAKEQINQRTPFWHGVNKSENVLT